MRSRALVVLLAVAACERGVTHLTGPVPDPIAAVEQLSGTVTQETAAGTVVTNRPTVVIRDAQARGVRGVPVYFRPRPGSGTIATIRVDSDSLGVAVSAPWTLSTTLGPQYLDATVAAPGFTGPYTFTVTSVVGPPASLAAAPDTLVLTPGATAQLTITARDALGYVATIAAGSLGFGTSNAAVASVSAGGEIEAHGGGLAIIRASVGAVHVDVPVAVDAPAVADFVVSIPSSFGAHAVAVLDDDRALVGGRELRGYRVRVPFPGAALWPLWGVWDIAHVRGEQTFYAALDFGAGEVSEIRAYPSAGAGETTLFQLPGRLRTLAVDPANGWVFAGGSTNYAYLYRINRQTGVADSVQLYDLASDITPLPAEQTVFVTAGVWLYEVHAATLDVLRIVEFVGRPVRVALVDGGARLVVVRESAPALVIDRTTFDVVATLADSPDGHDVAVHPDGTRFTISSSSVSLSGRVVEYAVGTWATLRTIPLERPLGLAYSVSGHVLVVTGGASRPMYFLR